MIDVTEKRSPAKTQLELYLRVSPLLGQRIRIDTMDGDELDGYPEGISESISGVVERVSMDADNFDDDPYITVGLQGEVDPDVVTVHDRIYRLDGTGWTLFSEGLPRDEEDDYDF